MAKVYNLHSQMPSWKEKAGAAIAYLTLGIWGLVWLLLSGRSYFDQKDFVRFHCYQSLFLGMLYIFIPHGLSIFFSLIIQIITLIPGTSFVASSLHSFHSILQMVIHYGGLGLIIYCAILSLFGKYTNVPWISQIINRMLR